MTKSRNLPLSFQKEAFFLVPQVLVNLNSIYNAFIASKIPTTKVSFQS